MAEMKLDYEILPQADLQSKVDYFITPYNNRISLDKHMNFGKSILSTEEFFRVMSGEILEDKKSHW